MNKPGFLRNKKTLGIFAAFALLLIGGTFAVSRDTSILANLFRIGIYKTSATEVFNSPSNWMTCETVEKSITVKNEGSMPVAARIKIDESWVDKDGNTLPLVFTDDNNNTQNWAVIDINTTDWIKDGEYYVYKEDLAPNATTSTFMTGVTLNCDANLADSAYSNATYTLTATIQTIDANYKSEWVTNHATLLSGARLNSKMRKLALLGTAEDDGEGEIVDTASIPEETLTALESYENTLKTLSPSMPLEEVADIYPQFLGTVMQVHNNTNIKAIRSASSLPENFDTTNPDNIISTDDSTTPIYAWYDNTNDAGIIYVYSDITIKANRNMGYSLMGLSKLSDISSLADWDMSDTESVFYFFGATADGPSLTDISALASWDTSNVTITSFMFFGVTSLTDISALANWDTSNVTDMSYMFYGDTSLTNISALARWDTSNVTNIGGMFLATLSLTDISALARWDTSNVTNIGQMFYYASSLTDISALANWDTSNVTNMSSMFDHVTSLTDISALANWDTSNVTYMSGIFYSVSSLTDISALANWDTSNVTIMSMMFDHVTSLTDISALANWDTSNVTNMNAMFFDASSLTDISALARWDTSNVTDMSLMFLDASSLTDISALASWDTSNVADMNGMFENASSLTDISALARWDTSNVTNMSHMFDNADGLTDVSALASWDTSNVTNMSEMFFWASSLTDISALANWNTSNVTNMSRMFDSTPLTDVSALASWDTSNVTDMSGMFDDASHITDLSPLNDWTVNSSAKMNGMFNRIPSSVARPTWYNGN